MTNFYIVGGTLAADAPSYIKRQADDLFYQALKDGQFCYILNSRQMGKSSLWVQTQKRLKAEGVRCVDVYLSNMGKSTTEESWYRAIFYELVKRFQLSINPQRKAWWDERSEVSPIQRLTQFVEEVLLEEVEQPIVICFDEIDSVLSLNFAIDAFFAWIRACYNQRANRAIYQRLTFCVMGVATVSNFIRDRTRTPFNIGKDISLSGFTKSDAQVLATGLEGKVSNPERVLEEVLEWTGGQPFLTQKLCQLISESRSDNLNSEQEIDVRDFVRSRIIDNWEEQDNPQHLRTIRAPRSGSVPDRLLLNPSTGRRMLKLYQEILEKSEIADDSSPDGIQLRLTGLVVQQNRRLIAYNRIYQQVFDRSWVEKELNQIPPFLQQYQAWLNSGKDSSELLSSQDLEEALEWSKDKSLEQSQNRFLQLSQIQEQQMNREKREKNAYQNQPANLTILLSCSVLVIFSLVMILVVVQTLRPQKQEPTTREPSPPVTKTPITSNTPEPSPPITETPITPITPEPSPPITETPTICTKIESTRENDIEKLEALKKQNPNRFSVQCETQLKELKLITRAVGLARNGIIANNEFGEDAFDLLCQVPTNSINIGEAKYWVNRWYQDDLNKAARDEVLKDNPQCEKLIEQ